MPAIIRAHSFANGMPCPHRGQWLESFDHDACEGQGYGTFTDDIDKAMRFKNKAEALEFWSRQSTVCPLRFDGLPNKPLTALTAAIEEIV